MAAAGQDRASTAEARACKMLDRMSELELRVAVKKMTCNVKCKLVRVAQHIDAALISIQLVIFGTLSEIDAEASETIWDERNSFSVGLSSDATGPSAWVCLIRDSSC